MLFTRSSTQLSACLNLSIPSRRQGKSFAFCVTRTYFTYLLPLSLISVTPNALRLPCWSGEDERRAVNEARTERAPSLGSKRDHRGMPKNPAGAAFPAASWASGEKLFTRGAAVASSTSGRCSPTTFYVCIRFPSTLLLYPRPKKLSSAKTRDDALLPPCPSPLLFLSITEIGTSSAHFIVLLWWRCPCLTGSSNGWWR